MTHTYAFFKDPCEKSHTENNYHLEIFGHVWDPGPRQITFTNIGQVLPDFL